MLSFLKGSFSKDRQAPVILIAFLNLALTVSLSLFLNVWIDEAYSLSTTAKDVRYALHQAFNFESQAPLYFILLNLWRNFNHSIFFARLFSILCITATIFLIPKISRRFFPQINPVCLALVVAFNPYTIDYAVEIRCYALVILLSALLILFFHDGFLAEIPSKSSQLFYTLFGLLGLYTQYYMGFLLVSNAIALLILKRWKLLVRYILLMVIVSLFLSPMLFFVPAQLAKDTATFHSSASLFYKIKFILSRFEEYIFAMRSFPVERSVRWIFRCIVLGLLFLSFGKNFRKYDFSFSKTDITIWTVAAVLSVCFFLLSNIFSQYFLLPRHTLILFIPSFLLLFSVLSIGSKKHIVTIFSVLMISLYGIALYVTYKPMAKIGDYARVANYVMSLEKPGQKILLFPPFIALPLNFYYSGINKQVSIPTLGPSSAPGPSSAVIHSEQEILRAICQRPGDYQNAWLITQPFDEIYGLRTSGEILEGFVDKYFSVESTKTFYGENTVRFLRKKSDSRLDCK